MGEPKGKLTVVIRAQCGCGIWKNIEETFGNLAVLEFEKAGWTRIPENPTCVRCSEVAALRGPLGGR